MPLLREDESAVRAALALWEVFIAELSSRSGRRKGQELLTHQSRKMYNAVYTLDIPRTETGEREDGLGFFFRGALSGMAI